MPHTHARRPICRRSGTAAALVLGLLLAPLTPAAAAPDPAPVTVAAGEIVLVRDDSVVATQPSIQAAVDAALPGDTVLIGSGEYLENVVIDGKHGTVDAPISVAAAPGADVTINGADPELMAPNDRWTDHGDGVFSAQVPWLGDADKTLVTWVSTPAGQLFAAHHNRAVFDEAPRGPDRSYRDGNTLWLSMAGGADPGAVGLLVGTSDGVVRIEDSSFVELHDLRLVGGGFAGVYLKGADYEHILLDGLTVTNTFRGVSTDDEAYSGTYVTVSNSVITNAWPQEWPWDGYYDASSSSDELQAPMRAHGIVMKASHSDVHDNVITGGWDGLQVQGEYVRIYRNVVSDMKDDGIELESNNSAYVEVFENTFYDTFTGFSVVSDAPGPIFVYRNTFSTNKLSYFKPRTGETWRYGYSIKNGRDWGAGAENVNVYQNSFFDMRMTLWDGTPTYDWNDFGYYNNVFYSVGERDERGTVESSQFTTTERFADGNRWNANLYYSERSPRLFGDWDGSGACATLVECRDLSPVFEAAGLQVDPLFADLDTTPGAFNDLVPLAASPVRDAGATTPADLGWPDSVVVTDGAPDIGRYELEGPAPLDPQPPAPVADVAVADVGTYAVALAWAANPETDLRGYNVYRSTEPSFEPDLRTRIATWVRGEEYVDAVDLVAGESYAYLVSAVDLSGNETFGTATAPVTIPPDVTAPTQVAALRGAVDAAGVITLDWADNPDPDLVSYRLYRTNLPTLRADVATLVANVPAGTSHAVDTDARAWVRHHYWVVAVDRAGLESEPAHVTVQAVPDADAARVLLIVQNATLSSADTELDARLRAHGLDVTVRNHDGLTGTEADGYDLLFLSPTVYQRRISTLFNAAATPLVMADYGLLRDMRLSSVAGVSEAGPVTIVDADHPLAAGLSGTVSLTHQQTPLGGGRPLPGAALIATYGSGAAATFGYDRGAVLADGSLAPDRRVFTFLQDRTANVTTAQGWALVDAAVEWALGED